MVVLCIRLSHPEVGPLILLLMLQDVIPEHPRIFVIIFEAINVVVGDEPRSQVQEIVPGLVEFIDVGTRG